jgi:hypothetical protein
MMRSAGRASSDPPGSQSCSCLQIEMSGDDESTLSQLQSVLTSVAIEDDPHLALPGDDRGSERLFNLREAVPRASTRSSAAQAGTSRRRETAGDMVVPFDRLAESIDCIDRRSRRTASTTPSGGTCPTATSTRTSCLAPSTMYAAGVRRSRRLHVRWSRWAARRSPSTASAEAR